MDAAIIAEAKSQTDQEYFAAERQLAQAQYEQDIQDANGNAAAIAKAERGLSDKLIQIKLDELDKRQQIGDAVFGAANNLFGGLAELVGKETALGKALFLFQQAAAIGQIIFNTAIANSKAVAQFPVTLGMPWVAINTASAVGSIASVVGQTIAGFSGGGYTGGTKKNKPAGIVHEGEWVASQDMVNNPFTGPIIANLEAMRTNPVTVTQAAVQASKSNQSSGSASTTSGHPELVSGSNTIMQSTSSPGMTNDIALKLIDVLENWDPAISIELLERRQNLYNKVTKGGLK